MSSCDVTIHLDGRGEDLAAGSDVTGRVTVTVSEPTEPANLRVTQLWRVHGRGNTHEAIVEERTEVLPRLFPGAPFEVPFRFRAPDAPVTYHGHLLNIDHYVRARVDKPWARDAVADVDYLVAPGPRSAEAYRLGKPGSEAAKGAEASGCMKAFLWLLAPVFLVLLVGLLAMLLPILLVAGIVVLVRRSLAEKRLGKVTAELAAPTAERPSGWTGPGDGLATKIRRKGPKVYLVAPGETVSVILRFTPEVDVSLNGAWLDLAATESATSGSGTDATTHRHVVWSQRVPLLEPGPLMRGVPVDVTLPVTLPWIGVYSLEVPSNKISWTASTRIDVPGWPDWVREDQLLMAPPQ